MKKNILIIIIGITLLSILLGACGTNTADSISQKSMEEGMYSPAVDSEMMLAEAPRASDSNSYGAQTTGDIYEPAPASDRMIIKNASMTIVVEDPKEAMNQVSSLAENQGGYIVSSSISEHDTYEGKKYYSADLYIRIPADKFDHTLTSIQNIAYSVEYQSVTGQDVTSEYVDLESQLRSLEVAEAQLTAIMEDARKTEDVLTVFRELKYVQSDIEVIKGRMKYLKESAAYSSISVNFQAKASIEPVTIGKWEPKGVALEAVQALVNFGKGLVNFLIWFTIFFLPMSILIGGALWVLIAILKKVFKTKKRTNKKETKEDKKE